MTKQPKRRAFAGAIAVPEMRDRLERARAALAAVKRAPESQAALTLEMDLARQIKGLERDLNAAA